MYNVALFLARPQSSSYHMRQRKNCAQGRGAGDDYPSHLAFPFSVPISPCALLVRCMKTTGDESAQRTMKTRAAQGLSTVMRNFKTTLVPQFIL